MKRIVAVISVIFIFALCIGCGKKGEDTKIKIGVSMPAKEDLSWNQEGNTMKNALTEAGYDVDLQFAGEDVTVQVNQMQYMIESGCKVIVVAPVDAEQLGDVLLSAKEKGVSIISYKDLIMNSDAVSYFVTFDDSQIGYQQGQYIVDALDLDSCPENQSYNIELFAGNAGDDAAKSYYEDAMEILQPYIDSGVLTVPSGVVAYEDTVIKSAEDATEDDPATAQQRMVELINTYYFEELILDAVYCVDDATAMEIATAIDYNYNGEFPVITGYGCTLESARSIVKSKQTMTVFMDTAILADKTVEMVEAILNNTEVPVNDSESFNNGVITVPAYVFETVCIDEFNYEEKLIESGYYTESQLN